MMAHNFIVYSTVLTFSANHLVLLLPAEGPYRAGICHKVGI